MKMMLKKKDGRMKSEMMIMKMEKIRGVSVMLKSEGPWTERRGKDGSEF